jgi:hypothetical protein
MSARVGKRVKGKGFFNSFNPCPDFCKKFYQNTEILIVYSLMDKYDKIMSKFVV